MPRFTSLPIELVSGVVEKLVREYLLEHFVSPDRRTWNAVFTLCAISTSIRRLTQALLTSGLSIAKMGNGRSPLHAIVLARIVADRRIAATCVHDANTRPIPRDIDESLAAPPEHDNVEEMWWKSSPLLELYSTIREVRFVSDRIIQNGNYLKRLADMPKNLVKPMEAVKAMKDTRLIGPALIEGAVLIACTSFVAQLSASARFFNLVTIVLLEKPEWLHASFDNIDQTLLKIEGLEKNCSIPMRWIDIDHPQFVKASHIHASRIVSALSDFLEVPVIISDPRCVRWRKTISLLLNAWGVLDCERTGVRGGDVLLQMRDI